MRRGKRTGPVSIRSGKVQKGVSRCTAPSGFQRRPVGSGIRSGKQDEAAQPGDEVYRFLSGIWLLRWPRSLEGFS